MSKCVWLALGGKEAEEQDVKRGMYGTYLCKGKTQSLFNIKDGLYC